MGQLNIVRVVCEISINLVNEHCGSYNVRDLVSVRNFVFFYFTGYRHIKLLSSAGEEIPGCTLFVHVTTTAAVDKVIFSS